MVVRGFAGRSSVDLSRRRFLATFAAVGTGATSRTGQKAPRPVASSTRNSHVGRRYTYERLPPHPPFEPSHIVLEKPGWFTMVFATFHPDVPLGSYLLLFDQLRSPLNARYRFIDSDPAIFTMGPTLGRGATSALSFADAESPAAQQDGKGDSQEPRGFPVDRGLIAVVSSTPGVLTQVPGTAGVRLTVRVQY